MQDKRGFLWIATENGLSRFDGQKFQNYTVSNCLPDNDIVHIFLDSSERLWIIPFSKNPAYIDTRTSKIVNASLLPGLNKIAAGNGLLGNVLPNGDVVFYENSGSLHFISKDGRITTFPSFTAQENVVYAKQVFTHTFLIRQNHVSIFKNGKITASTERPGKDLISNKAIELNGSVYFGLRDSGISKISKLDETLTPKYIIKRFPFRIWNISSFKNYVVVTGRNGIIYLLSPEDLEIIKTINVGGFAKDIFEDRNGNYWVSTESKGLLKITNTLAENISFSFKVDNNITALYVDETGLLAGNNSGDILEIRKNKVSKYLLDLAKIDYNNIFIKKIFYFKNKNYFVGFGGLYSGLNGSYKKLLKQKGFKDAVLINDSTLLLGAYNYLDRYHFNNNVLDTLLKKRITSLTVVASNEYYFGSNDGLYKLKNEIVINLGEKNKTLANTITTLLRTEDGLIWAGMPSDTLVALQNDSVIFKLPLKKYLQGTTCKALASKKQGQLWIGTEKSLGRIDYVLKKNKIDFKSVFFDKTDGLGDGLVNQIVIYKDTVYVATGEGISKINVNATPVIKEVPVYITKILINYKTVDIEESYELKPFENNIQVAFAGVDLTEYKPLFQYKINNSDWINVTDNALLLSGMASGEYVIQIRALKRDNVPSVITAILKIKIKTPFYGSLLFWVLAAILLTAFFFWLYNRRKLAQQKAAFQQQIALEQQRNKITADLHDDIGASLSSLQVNSAVANQLVNKDIKQAKLVLNKIETQAKNIADKIGDIIWSMKPGKDEFMTISSRIKTFANDMLGATNIIYTIQIDKRADTEIKDIGSRKNIVLITKEALNNAVKYSKAKNITIELKIKNNKILLSITDDGIGFIVNGTTGNGIVNMKKRTEELNGVFRLIAEEKKGTAINCEIPL